MAGVYTLGDWMIEEGSEQDFVEAWTELADWTVTNVPGSSFAKVLRDRSDPRRFLSFGPWRDPSAVGEWQSLPGFQERIERLRGLAESVELRMLDVASEVGAATPDPW